MVVGEGRLGTAFSLGSGEEGGIGPQTPSRLVGIDQNYDGSNGAWVILNRPFNPQYCHAMEVELTYYCDASIMKMFPLLFMEQIFNPVCKRFSAIIGYYHQHCAVFCWSV